MKSEKDPVPFEDLKMVPGSGMLEAWLKAINLMMQK